MLKVVTIALFVIALLMVNGCAITCLALSYHQDNMEISAKIQPQAIDVGLTVR